MEKPGNNANVKQQKNKGSINIGKPGVGVGGGAGIGVGIIFLGGAAAAAAFLFIRRLRKPTNGKNRDSDESTASTAEIAYKFLEDKKMKEDKGLGFVAVDSPQHMDTDQISRNGTLHKNDSTKASDKTSFFPDKKHKLQVEDTVLDDQGLIHSDSPKELDSSEGFDAPSVMEEEDMPLPIVDNKRLPELTTVEDKLTTQEFVKIKEDSVCGAALFDQGIEGDMLVNDTGGGKMDSICWEQQGIRELGCQETGQSCGERKSPIHNGEESKSIQNLLPITSELVGEGSFQPVPVPCDKSRCNDLKLDYSCEESTLAIKTDDDVEAVDEDQAKDSFKTQIVDGLQCPEHFGKKESNERIDASFEDQDIFSATTMMFTEVEEKSNQQDCKITENETIEAAPKFPGKSYASVLMSGGENKCQFGWLTGEAAEVKEDVNEEAEAVEATEILHVGEEKEAKHGEDMTGEQNQAARETTTQLPDDEASGCNHLKQQMDELETSLDGDRQDNSVFHEQTSEGTPTENCGTTSTAFCSPAKLEPETRIDDGYREVQQSFEPTEMKKQNLPTEISEDKVVESDARQMELIEGQQCQEDDENGKPLGEVDEDTTFEQRCQSNLITEEHNNKLIGHQEDCNDDMDETDMVEKAEESSEGTETGTGASSTDSNAEPIWPAEFIEELAAELKELEVNDSKEKSLVHPKEEQAVNEVENNGFKENRLQEGNDGKGNWKSTLLHKSRLQLAGLGDQTANLHEGRILILAIFMLSTSLGTWYFGMPYLKICLIIILIKMIAKMHGI